MIYQQKSHKQHILLTFKIHQLYHCPQIQQIQRKYLGYITTPLENPKEIALTQM